MTEKSKGLDGLRGVFRTLAQEHSAGVALIQRVKSHPDQRRELWPELRTALLSHDRGEIHEVYSALRQHEATRVLAEQHDDDAGALQQMIDRLDTLDLESDAWEQLFAELAQAVVAHAGEEDQVIFPAAQEALGEALAEELDRKLLAAKR